MLPQPMATSDVLGIVEAAYAIDRPDDVWLREIARACRPHLDRGFGIAAFMFRHDGVLSEASAPPEISKVELLGVPQALGVLYPTIYETMPPGLKKRPFA